MLEKAVDRLTARLAEVADLDYNFTLFDGEKTQADDVVTAANQLPFMSDKRLVVVRDVDRMAADELKLLAAYAGNPNPTTTLVLVAAKLARNSRLYKAVAALEGVAEYKAPSKRDYPKVVVEMFAEHGKRAGYDAAEVLVRAVGYDLQRLSTEVEKVVAFTGDEATLSRAEVEQVMSTTAPTSVWDFLDALGSRDAKEAMRLLSNLVSEGETVYAILPRATARLRELISTRALMDRGEGSVASLARALGRPEWQVRALPRQAERFTHRELADALRSAARADGEMKTSRDPRLAFERWVLSICR
ncbi:MAG: DNA polymerase III subunit delta [Coriobacteriia bacterium]|nr:DNA polymerase III subunit delta [Coriobacteriia bacterium]